MANRKLPTSLSTPPVDGPSYMDAVSSKVGMLFNSISLKPTAVTNVGNDYTITVDPVLDADVVAGMSFFIRPSASNTGPCRLRVTSANPWYDLVKASGEALASGDFVPGTAYFVVFMGGEFRILSVANSEANDGASLYYQEFLVSGTWTKPAGLSADALVFVDAWGAGGGGGTAQGAGGGGAFNQRTFRASDLTASVAITVGAGGATAATGSVGGNTSFGSYLTAYGGGGGSAVGATSTYGGGGGGGGVTSAGATGAQSVGGAGGGPLFQANILSKTGGYGGTGGVGGQKGDDAIWGGGGGGCGGRGGGGSSGGHSVYGGGGGGGMGDGGVIQSGGTSQRGGNGGQSGQAGAVPGGGGGSSAVGGAGKVIVRVVG